MIKYCTISYITLHPLTHLKQKSKLKGDLQNIKSYNTESDPKEIK